MSVDMSSRSDDKSPSSTIEFFINGVRQKVSGKFPPSSSLNDYIRDVAGLKGTKVMCREAGCGCCAVTVTRTTNDSNTETMSINSCTCPLYSVDGWQITTVEGIGSHKEGLHPIQERLAKYNGSQCGYCSPGFVMSMYGLLHQQPKVTEQEIEDSLDGHICRCTGYRPILDAMRTFGSDSSTGEKLLDIEDLNMKLCPKTSQPCKGKVDSDKCTENKPKSLAIDLNGCKWFRPVNLVELTQIVTQHATSSTKMLYGNTATGIFKDETPFEVYIDLHGVSELHVYQDSNSFVTFGAGITLTQLIEFLKGLQNKPGFHYCDRIVKHLKILGSVLVRNAGCIAGNLMIKHAHNEFPSDLFTIMEAVGATVEYLDLKTGERSKVDLQGFLQVNMKHKVLLSLEIPMWKETDFYQSFKVTPRAQNAHAYVNAAFKIPNEDSKIISKPNIVFGGISATTIHAKDTEEYLNGKELNDAVIQNALKIMHSELIPSDEPLQASPKYKKDLAINLLYKTLMEIYKPSHSSIKNGTNSLERALSSGIFTFQEKPEEFPMKEPMPKKTSTFQTAGEAQYINDIPKFENELAAAFVTSSLASASIQSIDTTEALEIPGVVRFIGARDLSPDFVNNSYSPNHLFTSPTEELFVSKDVSYEGQIIGVILADTQSQAEEGARKVKVTYENIKQPIMTLETAISENSIHEGATQESRKGDVEGGFKECTHVVQGELRMGTQYHFFLENHVALTVPTEDGIDVYACAQWPDLAQGSVAQVLNKPRNYCNVIIPRVGGSFGGKMFRASACAAASAICTELTRRPVRLNTDLSTCMKITEKRCPILAKYRAGCDDNGKMQAVEIDIYLDSGYIKTPIMPKMLRSSDQGYYVPNWRIKNIYMKTNKAVAGACRGPGALPGAMISETIMEHIAREFGKHPILLKEINLYKPGQSDIQGHVLQYCSLSDMWKRLKEVADVAKRMDHVETFNKNNMWMKKGINMTAVKYIMNYIPGGYPTCVSLFAGDGSVSVTTAGIEVGQGLFTKVAQAVAYTLGVPIDKVKVKPNNINYLPNTIVTAASTTSERCVRSAIAACERINSGLNPLKEKMEGAPMQEILKTAVCNNIPLYATVEAGSSSEDYVYTTFMVAVNETEVDVLTGEFQLKRVDIMADFGESLNPTVDLGQVQGAYIHGLGSYMFEDVLYDGDNGQLLNDGSWEYKPPTAKDIPIDWRIHFLPDNPNSNGVLGSKATGEPPIGLSAGAVLSIKSAMEDVRRQLTDENVFLNLRTPFTVERIQQTANIGLKNLQVT